MTQISSDYATMIDRGLAVIGLAGALLLWALPLMVPRVPKKFAWAGAAIGLVLFVVGVGMLFWPASAQPPGNTINGDCNAIGSNNYNCSQITVAPKRLTLTDAVKSNLLANIPKDEPGFVDMFGPTPADLRVGQDILSFLRQQGYDVQSGDSVLIPIPAPERPLALIRQHNPDVWRLEVAPSAR